MKCSIIKPIITTFLAVIIATGVTYGAKGSDMNSIMEKIRTEQAKVNQDLVKVNQQQDKVKALCKAYKDDKGKRVSSKSYKDAKSELKDLKVQLMKDGDRLMAAHKEHVKAHKQEARAEVRTLEKAQRKLDADKIRGRVSTLSSADKTMDARASVREAFTALERARLERDKDWWVIQKEYKDSDANTSMQLASVSASENSRAEK